VLDLSLGDLLAEPSLVEWNADSGMETVPALRAALMKYRVITTLGSPAQTSSPPDPMERRVRHALEVSRAYSSWNHQDEALSVLLDAEQMAPEQVRHHFLGRQLVLTWIRHQRGKPSSELVGLAHRLRVLD
jgi:hypothetical protein